MEETAVLSADLLHQLTNGLQEDGALDIADGATDLNETDVGLVALLVDGTAGNGGDPILVRSAQGLTTYLDLVGDVGNDLDGLAEIVAAALALNDSLVDLRGMSGRRRAYLAGGDVVVSAELHVEESLVVAEVQIGFATISQNVDLSVLVGGHGAGIAVLGVDDVCGRTYDVGIDLDGRDLQSVRLQQNAEAADGNAFAEAADDSSGNDNVLHIVCQVSKSKLIMRKTFDGTP